MIRRCTSITDERYPEYGGRGIKVCERWCVFENFFADMGKRPPRHTLDRKDNDGNYEPDNVRWATAREQSNNRRVTRFITYQGKTQPASVWCEQFGVPLGRFHARLKIGWSIHRALTEGKHVNQYD